MKEPGDEVLKGTGAAQARSPCNLSSALLCYLTDWNWRTVSAGSVRYHHVPLSYSDIVLADRCGYPNLSASDSDEEKTVRVQWNLDKTYTKGTANSIIISNYRYKRSISDWQEKLNKIIVLSGVSVVNVLTFSDKLRDAGLRGKIGRDTVREELVGMRDSWLQLGPPLLILSLVSSSFSCLAVRLWSLYREYRYISPG